MICAERGLKPQIELLLGYGVDVEKRDADGWTALMFAATEGAKAGCASLKLLLNKGANTEVKDTEFQMTAWLWAVDHGRCAEVQRARFVQRCLIFLGLFLFVCFSFWSETTANCARTRLDALQPLIDAGADTKATDMDGKNAREIAQNEPGNE